MGEQFFERLSKGPLLCDGAMGTMLYARAPESILHGRCFDELVLTDRPLQVTFLLWGLSAVLVLYLNKPG